MKEEYWFCKCDMIKKSYTVLSDAGCWEVCCLCKKVIKEVLFDEIKRYKRIK